MAINPWNSSSSSSSSFKAPPLTSSSMDTCSSSSSSSSQPYREYAHPFYGSSLASLNASTSSSSSSSNSKIQEELSEFERQGEGLDNLKEHERAAVEKSIIRRIILLCARQLCMLKELDQTETVKSAAQAEIDRFFKFGMDFPFSNRFRNALYQYFAELSACDIERFNVLFLSAPTDEIKADFLKAYLLSSLDLFVQRDVFYNQPIGSLLSRLDHKIRGQLLCLYALTVDKKNFDIIIKSLSEPRTKSLEHAAFAFYSLEQGDVLAACENLVNSGPGKNLEPHVQDLEAFRTTLIQLCNPTYISLYHNLWDK